MRRRKFLVSTTSTALLASAATTTIAADRSQTKLFPAQQVDSSDAVLPKDKRPPFGWVVQTVPRQGQNALKVFWSSLPADVPATASVQLRVAIGLDQRDDKVLTASLPESKKVIGSIPVRFATQHQIHVIDLQTSDLPEIQRQGIALRIDRGSDLHIHVSGSDMPARFRPHLFFAGESDPMVEFYQRLNSLASVQPLGWTEGCVLDGLMDLSEIREHASMKEMAWKHWSMFLDGDRLKYEDMRSRPHDGRLGGIEGGLPLATLARLRPEHPVIDLAIENWKRRKQQSGSIQDGQHMSSEGTYTVGYPLAEIAAARKSEELMQLALDQVRVRHGRLFDDDGVFHRTFNDDGKRSNRNWARGLAWHILGMVRTLRVARGMTDVEALVPSLRSFAQYCMKLQREDGLWNVFADDPKTTPDTSGSAGIAAALAIGHRQGWLDQTAKDSAQAALKQLENYLTPDGFLTGASQSNKGGYGLQASDYRVIFQMAMGLMAQCIAGLHNGR